jgi:hypothetical protein
MSVVPKERETKGTDQDAAGALRGRGYRDVRPRHLYAVLEAVVAAAVDCQHNRAASDVVRSNIRPNKPKQTHTHIHTLTHIHAQTHQRRRDSIVTLLRTLENGWFRCTQPKGMLPTPICAEGQSVMSNYPCRLLFSSLLFHLSQYPSVPSPSFLLLIVRERERECVCVCVRV